MKLSSIPLAVGAIVAIAGSTIAAPVALNAVDLEEVNPFERGVAVLERKVGSEPADYLFTREIVHENKDWRDDHNHAASACLWAAYDCRAAAKDSLKASKHSTGSEVQVWRDRAVQHASEGILLVGKYNRHKEAAKSPNWTPLHNKAHVDMHGAREWGKGAKQTSAVAKEIYQQPK